MTKEQESLLTFPSAFPIKVFGKSDDAFEKAVVAIVQKHAGDIPSDKITKRPSKDNKYIAITITIMAESKAQLDAIYQDLSDHELVLLAL